MAFHHEQLDVYKLAIAFIAWLDGRLEGPLKGTGLSSVKHLEKARQSIANNIAEENGKRSLADRCRFLDISRGSALECAACLDALAARKRISPGELVEGKHILERIVSMLWRMTVTLQPASSPTTTTSTSTSTSARSRR